MDYNQLISYLFLIYITHLHNISIIFHKLLSLDQKRIIRIKVFAFTTCTVCVFFSMWCEVRSRQSVTIHHSERARWEGRARDSGERIKKQRAGKGNASSASALGWGFLVGEVAGDRRLKLKTCRWTRGNPSHPMLLKGFSWGREHWRVEEWEGKDLKQGWQSHRPDRRVRFPAVWNHKTPPMWRTEHDRGRNSSSAMGEND